MLRRATILLNIGILVALALGAGQGWSWREFSGPADTAAATVSNGGFEPASAVGAGGSRLLIKPRTVLAERDDDLYGALGGPHFRLCDVERNGSGGLTTMAEPRGITTAPDGRTVYVAAAGANAVLAFDRNPLTGTLTYLESHQDGVAGVNGLARASSVAVSPDGGDVYVAGTSSAAIAHFTRDAANGELTFVTAVYNGSGGITGLGWPQALALSPDGASLYVACGFDTAVVFARDPVTGGLTWVQTVDGTTLPAGGLESAHGIAVAPDGGTVYVAAQDDHALVAFARDPASGALTFVDAEINDVGGVTGMSGTQGVAVSPDGGSVLAVGCWSTAIAVFDRVPATGELSFVTAIVGVPNGMGEVAIDPAGRQAFAVSFYGRLLASVSRAPGGGWAGPVEIVDDDLVGGGRLYGASSIAVSPDGRFIYVAAALDDVVTAFEVLVFRDGVETGDTAAWSSHLP